MFLSIIYSAYKVFTDRLQVEPNFDRRLTQVGERPIVENGGEKKEYIFNTTEIHMGSQYKLR